MTTDEIYLIDRNSYTLTRYEKKQRKDLTPIEIAIMEAMSGAGGTPINIENIKKWVEYRKKKKISTNAIAQHIHNLKEKGIWLYTTRKGEYIMSDDVWVN